MWLSKIVRNSQKNSYAETGNVSLSGDITGVYTDHESRNVSLLAPGGYLWSPGFDEQIISILTSDGKQAVLGVVQSEKISPGEIMLFSAGGAYITIKNDGTIKVHGNIEIDGEITETGNTNGNEA